MVLIDGLISCLLHMKPYFLTHRCVGFEGEGTVGSGEARLATKDADGCSADCARSVVLDETRHNGVANRFQLDRFGGIGVGGKLNILTSVETGGIEIGVDGYLAAGGQRSARKG